MSASFDLASAGDDAKDRATMAQVNAALARLAARRKAAIVLDGPLAQSKLAWKVAAYQQAILYRAVMLTEGVALAWNAGNVLTGFLAARALLETFAVMEDFKAQLGSFVAKEDLGSIDALAMNRTFATRDPDWLAEYPDAQAVNVLTLIDKLDKSFLPGVRKHYDFLSERCHPNSPGHRHMFSALNTADGSIAFSEDKERHAYLNHILGAVLLVGFVESTMDALDQAILDVAAIQHRLHPVDGA
jgi:hypothetical protein